MIGLEFRIEYRIELQVNLMSEFTSAGIIDIIIVKWERFNNASSTTKKSRARIKL